MSNGAGIGGSTALGDFMRHGGTPIWANRSASPAVAPSGHGDATNILRKATNAAQKRSRPATFISFISARKTSGLSRSWSSDGTP